MAIARRILGRTAPIRAGITLPRIARVKAANEQGPPLFARAVGNAVVMDAVAAGGRLTGRSFLVRPMKAELRSQDIALGAIATPAIVMLAHAEGVGSMERIVSGEWLVRGCHGLISPAALVPKVPYPLLLDRSGDKLPWQL